MSTKLKIHSKVVSVTLTFSREHTEGRGQQTFKITRTQKGFNYEGKLAWDPENTTVAVGDIPALGLPAPGGYKQVVCPDVRMLPGMPSRARGPRLPLRATTVNATGLAQHRGPHAPVPTPLPN